MPSVVCVLQKDILIGTIEKEIDPNSKGYRYLTATEANVIPYGKLLAGTKVQIRHGWNGKSEQRVYIACKELSGWFITKNKEGYSLNETFRAVRKNRTPWEALY